MEYDNMAFDPDAYLKERETTETAFDPDTYLAKAEIIKPPIMSMAEKAKEMGKGILRMPERVAEQVGHVLEWAADFKMSDSWIPAMKVYGNIGKKLQPEWHRRLSEANRNVLRSHGEKISKYWQTAAATGIEAPSEKYKKQTWASAFGTKAVTGAFESSGSFLGAIATSYITKNPQLGIILLSTMSGGSAFKKQKEKNIDAKIAQNIGLLTAAWEGLTEQVPFEVILNSTSKSMLKRFLKSGTVEGFQEWIQGIGENLFEYFGYNLKDWKSIPAALKAAVPHLLDNWLDNITAGFLMGGGAGAAIGPRGGAGQVGQEQEQAIQEPPETGEKLLTEFDQAIQDISEGKFDAGIAERKDAGVAEKKVAAIPGTQIEFDQVTAPITGVGGENIIEFFRDGKKVHQIRTKNAAQQKTQAAGYRQLLVKIPAGATPAQQQDNDTLLKQSKADAVQRSEELQQMEYEELSKLAEDGDELAAQRMKEIDAERVLEAGLPKFEVLFAKMLEGDEVAKAALMHGEYQGGRSRQEALEGQARVEEGAESVEKGISLERAQQLTGKKIPSAMEIRDSFDKMTQNEQNIVIKNVKEELSELQAEKRTLFQLRKETSVPDKPVYTQKINEIKKAIERKTSRLTKLQQLYDTAPSPKKLTASELKSQNKIRPKSHGLGRGRFWEYRDEKNIWTVAPNKEEAVKRANLALETTPAQPVTGTEGVITEEFAHPDFEAPQGPLTVFHGSPSGIISKFDPSLKGSNIDAKTSQLGVFFTNDPEVAALFSGKPKSDQSKVTEANLIMNKPFIIETNDKGDAFHKLKEFIIDAARDGGRKKVETWSDITTEDIDDYVRYLKLRGNDGIILKNTAVDAVENGHTMFIAFDPGQILTPTPTRLNAPVDPSVPPTNEIIRKAATVKAHHLAKALGILKKGKEGKKDFARINKDITGKASMEDMSMEEAKRVEAYFIAEAKKHGIVTSTGKELAGFIKANTLAKDVRAKTEQSLPVLQRWLKAPDKLVSKFCFHMKHIERLLEALDGFTEGPVYNSIWTSVQTALAGSRTAYADRVGKFKEALVNIYTPELNTTEGAVAAATAIAKEWESDPATTRVTVSPEVKKAMKARKLSKRAIRKLVGDSLWARFVTLGRETTVEASENGPELKLSPTERITVYLALKNEKSRAHLLNYNLAAHKNPMLTALEIIQKMPTEEKQIAEYMLQDLAADYGRVNQAAILGLGREIKREDNYFPTKIKNIEKAKTVDFLSALEDTIPETKKKKKSRIKDKPGFVEEKVEHATGALDLDAFSVYLRHLKRVEQFIHMAPVAKSVGDILNTDEFQHALNNVTAGHGAKILNKWLKHSVQGNAFDTDTGFASDVVLWCRQKGVLFTLAQNIPSTLRQFISGFNVVASHPVFTAHMAIHVTKSIDPRYFKMLENRMKKLSPEMKHRNFERFLARIKDEASVRGIITGKEQWSEKAFAWQKWADNRTVVIVWNSVFDAARISEAVQKQFEVDGSEDKAIHLANKLVARTQPMGDVEHLPNFFRGGPFETLISTFQRQVNNNWNFWAHDIYGMRKAKKISRRMVAWRILFSNILPSMMFGAISRGGLPDDWKDVLFDWSIYTVAPIFLAGRMVIDGLLGFAGGQTAVEDIAPATISKTIGAIVRGDVAKTAEYSLKAIGILTGRIPQQWIRTGEGIYDIYTGETDDLRRLIYSDWSLTRYGWPGGKEEENGVFPRRI